MLKTTLKRFFSLALVFIMVFGLVPSIRIDDGSLSVNLDDSPLVRVVNAKNVTSGNGTWISGKLTYSYSVDTSSSNTSGAKGSVSCSNATMTVKATSAKETSSCLSTTPAADTTTTVTVTNVSNKPLSVNTLLATGSAVVSGVSQGGTIVVGGTFTVSVTSPANGTNSTEKSGTVTIAVEELSDVTITASASPYVAYSINGHAVAQNGSSESFTASIGETISLPSITAPSGYTFLGWRIGPQIINATSFTANSSYTVYPVIVASADAEYTFSVGNTQYYFWEEAMNAAVTGSAKTVVLTRTASLPTTLAGNGLPMTGGEFVKAVSGEGVEFIVPGGVTLLIPFDAANTVITNSNIGSNYETYGNATTSTEYRRLTVPSNTKITVNGSLSVASKVYCMSSGQSGPYGMIYLNSGSEISFSSGASLYSFGFIKGAGLVKMQSGSFAYESMFVADYPGSASSLNSLTNAGVFPFCKFTVRNVEAPMTLYSGAMEKVYFNLYGTNAGYHDTWINMIGPLNSSAFFQTDSSVTKSYVSGRQIIETSGDSRISNVSISISALGVSVNVNTSNLAGIPIPYNFTINVKDGAMTLNENVILSKGSITTVDQGAQIIIPSGKNLYVLDGSDDVQQNLGTQNDAKLDVKGTIQVNGQLWTSTNGANITSSNQSGAVVLSSQPQDSTKVKLRTSSTAATEISLTAAQLHNGSNHPTSGTYSVGDYTPTAGSVANTTFYYCSTCDAWYNVQHDHTTPAKPDPTADDFTVTNNIHTYDGTSKNAKVTGKDGMGAITVTYWQGGVQVTSPTNAGTYTIKVDVAEGDSYNKATDLEVGTLTINKRSVTVSGITASDKIYDGSTAATLNTANAVISGKLSGDTLTVTATGVFADANVGTGKTVNISGLTLGGAAASNYELAASGNQTTATASINKKALTLTWGETSFTYDGQSHAPTAALSGVVEGDDVSVTVSGAQTNVGSYTATATLAGGKVGNYNLPGNVTVSFTIAKAAPVFTAPGANDLTYNGSEQALVTAGSASGGTMQYSLEQNGTYSTDIPTGVNAGNYTVWYKVVGDENHSDVDPVSIPVTIKKAAQAAPTDLSSSPATCVSSGSITGVTPAMEYSETESGSYTPVTGTEIIGLAAGTYYVRYRSDENHETSPAASVSVGSVGHDLTAHPAVPATCTTTGSSAYWSCSVCGKYFSDAEGTTEITENSWVIAALGHDWWTPEWSWNGYTSATATFTCQNDNSHTETIDAAITGSIITPATHDTDGQKVYTATVTFNGGTYTDSKTEIIPATGHYFEEPIWTWGEDHTATATFKCESCSYSQTLNATVTSVTTDATCVELGRTVYTATVTFNGETYTDTKTEIIPATGHTPAEAVEENRIEATCTEAGSYDEVVYCSVCGAELSRETKTIAALGHDLVHHEAQAATCTEIGWNAYDTCSRCDYTTYVEIPATGHTPAEAVHENEVAATCTTAGSYDEVVYCSVCHEELSRETKTIEALGHSMTAHTAVTATCTTAGNSPYWECTRCHKFFRDAEGTIEITENSWVIAALGHDLVHHDAQAATCTAIGWNAYDTCSRCDYTTYVEIPATGHTPAEAVHENEVAATCTTAGSCDEVVYCSVCHEELSRETKTVEALGHDLIHHEAQAATCTAIGWNAYDTCSRCDYTTYVEIPATGHTPAEAVHENEVAATCTTAGSYDEVVYCSVCGAELSRETKTIAALGHDWGAPEWSWNGYTSATATFTCRNDNSHTETIDAAITSEPGTTVGHTVYTATVVFDGREYTDTKDSINTYTITWKNWNGDELRVDTVSYGAVIECPVDPARTPSENEIGYYTFVGWDPAFTEGMIVTGDMVFTAVYSFTGLVLADGELWYYENGVLTPKGLIKIGDDYYYIKPDCTAVRDADYYVSKTNGLMDKGVYHFGPDGKMIIPEETAKNGLIWEDGKLWYYVDNVRTHAGLILVDGYYYYIKSNGQAVTNSNYFVSNNNDLMPRATHHFDGNGCMTDVPEDKNGLVWEGGKLWYYENGVKKHPGLIKVDEDYYYINSSCYAVTGCDYYVSNTNGLLEKGTYTFREDGTMVIPEHDTRTGLFEENGQLVYYVNGVKTHAGLILLNGNYYYIKSDCTAVRDMDYFVSNTNDLLPRGMYHFNADGTMVVE